MFYGGTRAGRARAVLAGCVLAGAAVVAVAGCASGGSSQPSWASKLGSGVTVNPPSTPSPSNSSPGGVMAGVVGAISSGKYSDFCKYEEPSSQATCNSAMSAVTSAQAKTELPTFKNVQVAYTAISGTKALIGITGTVCVPKQTPSCWTNTNPAAIFDSGKSFTALWNAALKAPANAYSLSTAIEVNGKWYAYTGG